VTAEHHALDTDEADAPAGEPGRVGSRTTSPVAKKPPSVPSELPAENEPETRRSRRHADRDDDDWQDLGIEKENVALSITSMAIGIASAVLGVLGSCCCMGAFASPLAILGGVAAIILGVVGMKRGGQTYAYVGIGLGGFAVLFGLFMLAMALLGVGVNLFGNMGKR
jgi:hypothetical protein